MAVAERDGERIVLHTEYRERELCKQVPGLRWSAPDSLWYLPLSWAGCLQLRGVFGAALQVGTGLGTWAKEERVTRVDPCNALRTAEDAEALSMFTELKPFQRAGAMFLRTARHALLADEMGLGKTVQAIAALESIGPEAYPALIVCPNSMKRSWAREFARWAPSRHVEICGSTAAPRRKAIEAVRDGDADVCIINYEALRHVTRLAGYPSVSLDEKDRAEKELNEVEWASLVGDEIHRAKDPRAKQTRALWYVGQHCRQRFALSGTPIANSPEDMWALMHLIAPQEFPVKTKFIERYALTTYNMMGYQEVTGIKGEMADELYSIIDPRFIRRTKEAVLPQLPAKLYTVREVEMDSKQKKAYEGMRKDKIAQLENGILMASNPLTHMLRLLQFASAHGEMGDPAYSLYFDGKRLQGGGPFATWEEANAVMEATITAALNPAEGDANKALAEGIRIKDETPLILTAPSCKVSALVEIVAELGDDRAVVFAESRQLIELAAAALERDGVKTGQVTGAVEEAQRQANLEAFNAGRIKVLLVTLGAGGEGLSFPGCTKAIFLQRSFNAIKNAQAEDRVHGIGRGDETKHSEIIDVVTANSAEARVFAALQDKERILQEIVRDEATVKAWLAK